MIRLTCTSFLKASPTHRHPGTGTPKYNGQEVHRTGPKPQRCPGEQCWLLRAAGLFFDEGPADTGIVACRFYIFVCSLLSSPHVHTEAAAIPPSFSHHDWWIGLRLNQPVKQGCWRVWPASTRPTGSPGSHSKRGTMLGEVHGQSAITALNSESSLKMDWAVGVDTIYFMFLAFWPVKKFFLKQNQGKPLELSQSIESFVSMWFVKADTIIPSTIKSVPQGTKLIFHTLKRKRRKGFVVPVCPYVIKNIIWQQHYLAFASQKGGLRYEPHFLVSLRGLRTCYASV